jgi:hypothetical protein
MHLHFEGLDLAGKSTVCRRFREQARGDWQVRHNALAPDNRVYALADELRRAGHAAEPIGWLYHAALLFDLKSFTPPPCDTLQDSTILLRSLAFHTVQGTPGLVDRLEALIERHPRFDRSFVLVASHETRLQRLAIRRPQNLGPEDFLVRDDPRRFFAMEAVLVDRATRHFAATVIDTSGPLDQGRLEVVFRHMPELERDAPTGGA